MNNKLNLSIVQLLRLQSNPTAAHFKLKRPIQSNKALRILDIIASPKSRSTATLRQTHLRLLEDVLGTNSSQPTEQFLTRSARVTSDVLDELLDSSFVTVNNQRFESVRSSRFDAGSLCSAVSSCAYSCNLKEGVQYHCFAMISGFVSYAYVGSSLINLYSKCGEMDNAVRVFNEMPVRNVVTWTGVISGFAQDWQVDVCLELLSAMRQSTLKPNDLTFTSLLSACTGSGALRQGMSAHCQIILMAFDSYLHVANALISMYCKCGSVQDAVYIFDNIVCKDVVSWNSMISGYAQHGLAMQAIELFERMKNLGVKPDSITFLGVLSACRHAGFVEGGRSYFNSMIGYGLRPELDHYSCLIDLLGRAALIEEARDVILRMPLCPNAVIWGSLLSSCRVHGSVWIGIEAAEQRLLLEPGCAATHVQLANLYASVRYWDQAARVRKLMKDSGLKTVPGYSWIEMKNKIYIFRAEDRSNTRVGEILNVLDCLVDHMALGNAPEENINQVAYEIV
ncbi:pentatricopeptide repeat-containing protein At2g37320 [Mercurialis annua]|uniref:pentatricopeptide repeat-containing protein At2g37320 n=1 Tax=Mercurialis annua TaxID=3986 RepID=UPI00215E1807|nr:pentatricopeptide repeat-containing protein At2g37320 [Mercurialis annua]XP_050227992.1 pentatricopeptide repeat-containing protein At2g37320 [Mercurialis annua]XP_050227994.1 pentatricopeptide repeat-containing protein At2g37320 [Mercurialis annua]XP_050227995.1 pentatricopeptide repeat-containing protein At2g37320 [Mercurialis annua]